MILSHDSSWCRNFHSFENRPVVLNILAMNISKPVKRVDNDEKVLGRAKFIADMKFDDMLYARTLRSTVPRARIISIEIPELPEGYFIVDHRDVPSNNRVKILENDMPFFAEDVVNYIGEPILLVVGPDRAVVTQILESIKVKYEELPAILSVEEAQSGEKPPIFGDDNLFADYYFDKGDPDAAFEKASRIVEGEYRTGCQEHIYLETQGMIGIYRDGKLTVYGSMQCPYYVKNALIFATGWDGDRIQVIQTTTGGAFGGKEDFPSLIAGHAAFAAIKADGKPVQIIYDRVEDIISTTKRHPSIVKHRTALDENGNIIAMDVDIILDAGAYETLSPVVLQRAMFVATSVYNVPNLRVRGRAYATNHVPASAFRGFGGPQGVFAAELHITNVAEAVGANPLDYKRRFFVKKGDTTATSGLLRRHVPLQEIADALDEMSDFRRKYEEYRKNQRKGTPWRGIGISFFPHGCGFTGKGEEIIRGTASLKRYADGRVEILVSSVEMGQGAQTTLRKIVAETLGIPYTEVIYENPDTDRVPDSGPTVASRTVVIVGGLLERAARELKERWSEPGEITITKTYRHPSYIQWDQDKLRGDAYPEYSWGGNVVEVEVDPVTFEIRVVGVWGAYDIGTPIDERIIRGQIEGGVKQALGYATIEVMETKNGRILQASLTDYIVPTSKDFPRVIFKLIPSPYEYGPYGAKCAGEVPFVGPAPALAAAVQQAVGFRVDRIPVKPEWLLEKELKK